MTTEDLIAEAMLEAGYRAMGRGQFLRDYVAHDPGTPRVPGPSTHHMRAVARFPEFGDDSLASVHIYELDGEGGQPIKGENPIVLSASLWTVPNLNLEQLRRGHTPPVLQDVDWQAAPGGFDQPTNLIISLRGCVRRLNTLFRSRAPASILLAELDLLDRRSARVRDHFNRAKETAL